MAGGLAAGSLGQRLQKAAHQPGNLQQSFIPFFFIVASTIWFSHILYTALQKKSTSSFSSSRLKYGCVPVNHLRTNPVLEHSIKYCELESSSIYCHQSFLHNVHCSTSMNSSDHWRCFFGRLDTGASLLSFPLLHFFFVGTILRLPDIIICAQRWS
jgi:hypothetical protein